MAPSHILIRGAPVTTVVSPKDSVTFIVSPLTNVESGPAELTDKPVTLLVVGSTLCAAASVTTWVRKPRYASAVAPARLIVPPFSVSAFRDQLIPVVSVSAATVA